MGDSVFKWYITSTQRKQWSEIFTKLTKQAGTQAISGAQAKEYFSQSKLDNQDLAAIWVLSDRDTDRQLNEEEFLIAQFLVTSRKSGQSIPKTLPEELVKSVKSRLAKNGSSSSDTVDGQQGQQPTSPKLKSSASKKMTESSSDPSKTSASAVTSAGASSTHASSNSSSTSKSHSHASAAGNPSSGGQQSPTLALPSQGSGSLSSSAPSSTKKKNRWHVGKEEKKRYLETFAKVNKEGFVDGPAAVQLFSLSQLPREDLASIWALSDMDRDTKLSQQEFLIAMHLISKKMNGEPIPVTVPTSLVVSASNDLTTKKSPKLSNRNATIGSTGAGTDSNSNVPKSQSTSLQRTVSATGSPLVPRASSMQTVVVPNVGDLNYGQPGMGAYGNPGSPQLGKSVSMYDASGIASPNSYASDQFDPRFTKTSTPTSRVTITTAGMVASRSSADVQRLGEFGYSGSSMTVNHQPYVPGTSISRPLGNSVQAYGVDDKVFPEYDATADIIRLDDVMDLNALKQQLAILAEEVNNITSQHDKAQLQAETLGHKLSIRTEQNAVMTRRRGNFENILSNYNAQMEEDMVMYQTAKEELIDLTRELSDLQVQLNKNPQFDLTTLRERRKQVQTEYATIRSEYNKSRDEHMNLAIEIERLKSDSSNASMSAAAGRINTHWSDHGFKEEPAVSFGAESGGHHSSGANGNGNDGWGSGSSKTHTPTFQFNPSASNFDSMPSGTMTPVIDDWTTDTASEAGDHDIDLKWMGNAAEFGSPHTSNSPTAMNGNSNNDFGNNNNADFFAAESAQWASFTEANDASRKKKAQDATASHKERKAKKTKSTDAASGTQNGSSTSPGKKSNSTMRDSSGSASSSSGKPGSGKISVSSATERPKKKKTAS